MNRRRGAVSFAMSISLSRVLCGRRLVAGDGGTAAKAVAAGAAGDLAVAGDLDCALQVIDDAGTADRLGEPLAFGARCL